MENTVVGFSATPEPRERWTHRMTFLVGAIASAVGLGNLWRFPYLSYNYGGGVFFIPYLLFLCILGFPMLMLEIVMGQMYQGSPVESWGRLNKRFRGIGWSLSLLSSGVYIYYIMLLGWGLRYLSESIYSPLPWAVTTADTAMCASRSFDNCMLQNAPVISGMSIDEYPIQCTLSGSDCSGFNMTEELGEYNECMAIERTCVPDLTAKAEFFFYDTVLEYNRDPSSPDRTKLVPSVVLVTFIMSLFVYFSIFKGVVLTGLIAIFTVVAPFLIVLGLFVYGATLPGAALGVEAYLGVWDFNVFVDKPTIWSDAAGQIFFTLSVTYGVMTAYASYNTKKQDFFQDTIIIGLTNFMVSVFCGFAVFSIAGYMVTELDLRNGRNELDIAELGVSGPSLVFITFPIALGTMGEGVDVAVGVLFFLAFLTLGLDSAFSLVEAQVTVVYDSRMTDAAKIFGRRPSRWMVSAIVTAAFFGMSMIHCTQFGFETFDAADYYLNQYASFIVGTSECVSVAWYFGHKKIVEQIGLPAVLLYNLSFWIGFGVIFVGLAAGYNFWEFFGIGVAIFIIGLLFSYKLIPITNAEGFYLRPMRRLYILSLGSIEEFRREVNSIITKNNWGLPLFWSFAIKYIAPVTLLILLGSNLRPSDGGIGKYGGYTTDVHVVGYYFCGLVIFVIVSGLLFPDAYKFISPDPTKAMEMHEIRKEEIDAEKKTVKQAFRELFKIQAKGSKI